MTLIKRKIMEYTIALIGSRGAGKTTYIKRLLGKKFDEKYIITRGCVHNTVIFSTNFGNVYFHIKDYGVDVVDEEYRYVDGIIVMNTNSNGDSTDGIINSFIEAKFPKNTPITKCFNDKKGIRTFNRISVKDDDISRLSQPLLSLLRVLIHNSDIKFAITQGQNNFVCGFDFPAFTISEKIKVLSNLNNDGKESKFTCYFDSVSNMVDEANPERICWKGYDKGMVKATFRFYKNEIYVEQQPVTAPNKVYWISVPNGMIRATYQFYEHGSVIEQV